MSKHARHRPLTVNQLHKKLAKLIEQGHGRAAVSVHKETFFHPLESDGAVILDAYGVSLEYINVLDDDGWTAMNKNGTERMKKCAVLTGWETNPKGTP